MAVHLLEAWAPGGGRQTLLTNALFCIALGGKKQVWPTWRVMLVDRPQQSVAPTRSVVSPHVPREVLSHVP